MVVVFRVDMTGEVFALLPFVPATVPGYITCYERDGPVPADYEFCIRTSRVAKKGEYASLLKSMKSEGYRDLVVRRRRPRLPRAIRNPAVRVFTSS